jgi:hypothetical protein
VAPLRLGGLRGKKSTPSVWLGGTGELIEVGKQEQEPGYWAFCTYRVYSLLLGVYAVRWAILHCVGTVFPHSGRVYRVSGVLCMCRVRFT